jgi:hypothetical protein
MFAEITGLGILNNKRKLRILRNSVLALIALLTQSSALAHHSFAMFDHSKEVELKDAAVVEWQWTNPHGWLLLYVPNGTLNPDRYSVECANPAQLRRQGFGIHTFKPGDKITVYITPLLNGLKGGALQAVLLPDGTLLGEHLHKPTQ